MVDTNFLSATELLLFSVTKISRFIAILHFGDLFYVAIDEVEWRSLASWAALRRVWPVGLFLFKYSWNSLESFLSCANSLNAVSYKRCFPFRENFGYKINFPFEHAEDRMSTLSPNINSRCLKKHYLMQWKIPRFSQLLSQQTRHFVPFGSLFVFNQIINSKWISSVFLRHTALADMNPT